MNQLDSTMRAEYLWIDGDGEVRGKTKILGFFFFVDLKLFPKNIIFLLLVL